MNAVEELRSLHFRVRTGGANWQDCVNWAMDRLRKDEEGDDLDVVMLAAATVEDEVPPLVTQIVERYLGTGALESQVAAGKLIVDLYDLFKSGRETAATLDPKFWRLYYDLGQPSWLTMLARNCEYATDIPAFEKPFEEEFDYIVGLWRRAGNLAEFEAMYDRRVSNSHDLPTVAVQDAKQPWWKLW